MYPTRRHPTHPGIILQEEFLIPLKLSPKHLAKQLGKGWSELKVNAILKGKEGISALEAHELASFFGNAAEFWIRLQEQVHHCEQRRKQQEKGSLKPWKKAQ